MTEEELDLIALYGTCSSCGTARTLTELDGQDRLVCVADPEHGQG